MLPNDDDDPFMKFLRKFFNPEGFQMRTVHGGQIKTLLPTMETIEYDDRIVMVQNLSSLGSFELKHELVKDKDVKKKAIVIENANDPKAFRRIIVISGDVEDDYELNFVNGVLEIILKKIL